MDQSKKYLKPDVQVNYKGRWVPRSNFRVYVYNENQEKLAETYEEYSRLIASGEWFDDKEKKIILPAKNEKNIKKDKGQSSRSS